MLIKIMNLLTPKRAFCVLSILNFPVQTGRGRDRPKTHRQFVVPKLSILNVQTFSDINKQSKLKFLQENYYGEVSLQLVVANTRV